MKQEGQIIIAFCVIASVIWYFGTYKKGLDSFIWEARRMNILWPLFSKMPEDKGKARYLSLHRGIEHLAMGIILIAFILQLKAIF